ncbi:MAG: thiamine phosphate synthase [Dehalococcoidia bacterium]
MDAPGRLTGLYAIIDPESTDDPISLAAAILRGGARVIQLRDKRGPADGTIRLARALVLLCRAANVPLIVNDRLDVAIAADADGVHLGQHDLTVAEVRRIVGDQFIVGCSTNTVEEARRAVEDGADYLGVGAIYPTSSKHDTRPAGLARLAEIRAAVRLPIVAIGGIDANNAGPVVAAGADMVAVIGALARVNDPEAAARRLAALFA